MILKIEPSVRCVHCSTGSAATGALALDAEFSTLGDGAGVIRIFLTGATCSDEGGGLRTREGCSVASLASGGLSAEGGAGGGTVDEEDGDED